MNTPPQALGENYLRTNMAVRNSKSLTIFFLSFQDGNGYIADEELDALMHDLLANSNQVTALQPSNCPPDVLRTESGARVSATQKGS